MLAIILLWAGFGMYGAGHGDTAAADKLWFSGLALCVAAWSLLFGSVVEGTISWRRSRRPVVWIVPGALLLILITVMGFWAVMG